MSRPLVVQLVKTIDSVPSEWQGRLEDDRYVYIKYRHSTLRVSVGSSESDAALAELLHDPADRTNLPDAVGDGETLLCELIEEDEPGSCYEDVYEDDPHSTVVFVVAPSTSGYDAYMTTEEIRERVRDVLAFAPDLDARASGWSREH